MRQIEKILLMSLTVASLCSCRQGLLDTAPYDGYSSENMWTTDVNCEQGVTGIYSALRKDYVAAKPYYFYCCPIKSIEYKRISLGHCIFNGRVLFCYSKPLQKIDS